MDDADFDRVKEALGLGLPEANGDVLFIDFQGPASPVFSWDHETHEVRTEASSMAELAQRAREEAASF